MRTSHAVATVAIVGLTVSGCSGEIPTQQPEKVNQPTISSQPPSTELVPGFTGGCPRGIKLWTQRQFEPYGATVRAQLEVPGQPADLFGNDELIAVGWYDLSAEPQFLPDGYETEPEGLRAETWYYVPSLSGWIGDAGVRPMPTEPIPVRKLKPEQLPPKQKRCELQRE